MKILLDFETSGLNPYHDDIIEIGMKDIESEKIFTCLIQPKSNELISDKITEITGITNKLLKNQGMKWEEAYISMNKWLFEMYNQSDKKNIIIISHNGEVFDFILLRRILLDLKKLNIKTIPMKKILYIDTLLFSKRLLPGRQYYNQGSLCRSYNINMIGSHRSMNDVICLEQLWNNLVNQLDKKLNKRYNIHNDIYKIIDYIQLKI